MDVLKQRILQEGQHLGRGILKVDSFVNHQVDAPFMMLLGREFARRFGYLKPTKVLTAEISGIAPALATAYALDVPLLYARKTRPITMPAEVYRAKAPSHTKGGAVELMVSPEFLKPEDRVLIIDDFLATGQTILALVRIVQQANATLVGIGAVIEKAFEGGRDVLAHLNVPIESLVVIERFEGERIIFRDPEEQKVSF